MIIFENLVGPSPEQMMWLARNVRNPLKSWSRLDSTIDEDGFHFGDNDASLWSRLEKAGSEHRKQLRAMPIFIEITAPLFWWKQLDTYKLGTVRLSCSTMHKLGDKPFTLDDFSQPSLRTAEWDEYMNNSITSLNAVRDIWLSHRDDRGNKPYSYFEQMVHMLPDSYLLKAGWCGNYEELATIVRQRQYHKLGDWRDFVNYVTENVPYYETVLEPFIRKG